MAHEKKLLPGLSLDKFLSDVGKELGHQAGMGAQELGKAQMHGHDPYVLYQRDGKDDGKDKEPAPLHGLPDHTPDRETER